ncbi:phage terminase small subunit [Novosphingobium aquae]|uniref:Phage terminase small subunit n=1 Tax=Novosphingobium aquae TaxID=3133435 RepID=A0ABU8S416_9SPHN
MAFSPALAHRQRVLASQSTRAMLAEHAARAGAAPPMPSEGPVASEYQSLLARLHEDLRRLHDIQSTDAKVALKRDLIKGYMPWIEGVLTSTIEGAAPQDEIVVTCFIWSLDIREWTLGLDLFNHINTHGLQLPERFHRSPRGVLLSEMSDAALADPGSVPHDTLLAIRPGPDPVPDVKDETMARVQRAIGESWSLQADSFDPSTESAAAGGKAMLVDAALAALREAIRLDPKVGVKKQIEQLEREAKKLVPEDQQKPAVTE